MVATVTLKDNGRVTTVTTVAACQAGENLHFDISLTQGAASGSGHGAGKCTGGLTRYPVPAHGLSRFVNGPAQVSAEAVIGHGSEVETQAWTRQANIVSAP
jgi:hypothetical protein